MTSTDTAVRKPRKPRVMPLAQEHAPPLVPTLPADLEALDRQIASDDEMAATALLRGRAARREMVDEIALLRRQVEALTQMNGDLVTGLTTFEEGYKTGEPKFRALFALTPGANDQAKALKAERETFYAARMAKDAAEQKAPPAEPLPTPNERRLAEDFESALAEEAGNQSEGIPAFLTDGSQPDRTDNDTPMQERVAQTVAAALVFIITLPALF